MAHSLLAGTQHELAYFSLTEDDEGYAYVFESTRLEEEYICLPSHGGSQKEAEMDEEQQVLYEGSFVLFVFLQYQIVQWYRLLFVGCTHHGLFFCSAFSLARDGPGLTLCSFCRILHMCALKLLNITGFLLEVCGVLICTFPVLSLHCLGVSLLLLNLFVAQ